MRCLKTGGGGGVRRPFFRFLSDLRNQQDQQERDFLSGRNLANGQQAENNKKRRREREGE